MTQESFAVVIAVTIAGAVSSAIDLRTRRVPNALTLGIATVGTALAAFHWSPVSVPGALLACALGVALMLPGHMFGGTGAGDVKLFGATATLLGPQATAMAFLYTAVVGGVLGVIVASRRRQLRTVVGRTATMVRTGGGNTAEIEAESAANRFAYAPAVAVGTLVAVLGW